MVTAQGRGAVLCCAVLWCCGVAVLHCAVMLQHGPARARGLSHDRGRFLNLAVVSGAPACGAKKRAPTRGEPRALMKTLRFWGFQPEPELALVLWLSETQSGKSYGCACFIGGGWFFSVAGPRGGTGK